ncbi:MAG: lipopolysaccharide assembly protein LapB [Betaproteobacteria bacterium]|nr:lipopolysaccharide assembly protein LapB [Betaproteobacteria bacterium]
MFIELWWLLLIPAIFFALGWIAARIDIRQLLAEARELPRSYFEGLNSLLNEAPDQAIESFMVVAEKDPKTLDLHFALGTLFRRQGEFSRAIRMHQSLLERPELAARDRERVEFELAQDFHRAGLLDRAETLFLKLEGTRFEHEALGYLLEIYETEKHWPEAIRVTRQMEAVAQTPHFKEIAHYHCEMAEEALVRGDPVLAQQNIEQAFAEYRACVRAFLIQGDIELARNEPGKALAAWEQIASHQINSLGLAAERIVKVCQQTGKTDYALRLLTRWQQEAPSLDIFHALFQLSLAEEGPQAAAQRARSEIEQRSSLFSLDHWLQARLSAVSSPEAQQSLLLIKNQVAPYLKKMGQYRCTRCGFRARQYYWRCPGCQKWETTQARRSDTPEGFR